ncbi:MAG TPA: sigma-70 family RNA polymerase sigma factor [Polyangiaceae bacterium]
MGPGEKEPSDRDPDASDGEWDASEGDSDAPDGDAPADAASADALPEEEAAPDSGPGEPDVPIPDGEPVTRAEMRAFLGERETQDRIREVVTARSSNTPADVIDDIVQKVNEKALKTGALPRSSDGKRGWIGAVAATVAMTHFRDEKKERKWVNREAAVEEQPPAPEDMQDEEPLPADGPLPPWMISRWLREQVAKNPEEKRTLDLIVRKARSKKGYADIAAAAGMTENQLNNRVHRLKEKYLPLRQKFEKDRRDRFLLWWRRVTTTAKWAAVAAVVGAIVWWLLHRNPHEDIRPEPEFVPGSATASAAPPPPFDQALPPTEQSTAPTPNKPPAGNKPPLGNKPNP